jgi:DNA-directed RNA polymerase specialized sigma24 family protein
LIWSICRRYQLCGTDADGAGQTVWLQLVGHLGELRDPAALADWLGTTTRRECGRLRCVARGKQAAEHVLDAESISEAADADGGAGTAAAERHAVLHEALTHLPHGCQQLIALLNPGAAFLQTEPHCK